MENIIKIAKHFGISLDLLILGNDERIVEEMKYSKEIKPQYENLCWEEFYPSALETEYMQCVDEGLDIEEYKNLFYSIAHLPHNEISARLGDVAFDVLSGAKQREDYRYVEPSALDEIKDLRCEYPIQQNIPDKKTLKSKIAGAWTGRICGCLFGKPIEGIHTNELIPLLKETNNYPLHRYILSTDITEEIVQKYDFPLKDKCYADTIDGMPVDDDINYVTLAQVIVEKYGRDFTSYDISRIWLDYLKRSSCYTAERVALCNFFKGFAPPASALYHNPFREYIGAQIRGDYFGYINPRNPEKAADMAFEDAAVSHVKNGIYGEMFISAMLACAAVTDNIEDIICGGLAQIPYTSRLYEAINDVLEYYKTGTAEECFEEIHKRYDEYINYGWCHVIPNAMIVAASLLFGRGDFGKSICMAVETAFDTDCNGATVGSILGMRNGIESIPECWTNPLNNTIHTSVFGYETAQISDMISKTMEHIDL